MRFIFFCFLSIAVTTNAFSSVTPGQGSPTSPTLQELPGKTHTQSAHYGFLIYMPCSFHGISTIYFQHNNDPVYYYKSIPVNPQNCVNSKESIHPVHVFLKEGTWKIINLSQMDQNQLNNAYPKSIRRNLSFVVQKEDLSKPFFYIGGFEWQSDSKLFFIRNFALSDIRKLFGENQVYNGYTGDRIVRDKILGTTSVLFREINTAQAKKSDVVLFQQKALHFISTCLKRVEANNPLLALEGNVLFYNEPKDDSVNKNESKIFGSFQTVKDFQSCLAANEGDLPRVSGRFVLDAEISSL